VLRVLDELLFLLRRAGLKISPAQAATAIEAVAIVGLDDRDTVREALAAVLIHARADRPRFDAVFDRFFQRDAPHARDLFARLLAQGFEAEVVTRLRELLEALASAGPNAGDAGHLLALLSGEAARSHLLSSADVGRMLAPATGTLQAGFFAQKAFAKLGFARASRALGTLRTALEGAFGPDVGGKLADALARELDVARSDVRAFVEDTILRRDELPKGAGARDLPFTSLSDADVEDVRRAVRILGERLRGAARVRERHARRGRIDPHRSIRRALRTGGVPFSLLYRRRRRDRPRLYVLCDVSDSVRTASVFLLELVAVMQELFERTRTFVFVSELGETTALFGAEALETALAKIFRGEVVNLAENSNYGRVLRQFEAKHLGELDRRCTVVILGDGRTNHQPPEVEVLARVRERVRSLIWLCPERPGSWGTGDSVMPRYAKEATQVLLSSTATELAEAARTLLVRR
jgi:uncharacterized protein